MRGRSTIVEEAPDTCRVLVDANAPEEPLPGPSNQIDD